MSAADLAANPAVVLVAAIGQNNVIGRDNQLPWRLSSDLKHFKALTLGKPVVMGRKTYESIGKPLPGRTNIVVTRDRGYAAKGCTVVDSIEDAVGRAGDDAAQRGVDQIMVIGGSDLFKAMMPFATRLDITHVHAAPEGDVFFPAIDPAIWREAERTEHRAGPGDSADFAISVYLRR